MSIADILRWMATSEICLVVGFLLATISKVRSWQVDPWHVIGMGFTYILFAGAGALELQLRFGHPGGWRTAYLFITATLALVVQIYTYWYWRSGRRWARTEWKGGKN